MRNNEDSDTYFFVSKKLTHHKSPVTLVPDRSRVRVKGEIDLSFILSQIS